MMQAPPAEAEPVPDPIISSASNLTLEDPHPPLVEAINTGFLHLTDDQFESVVAAERNRRQGGSSQPTNQEPAGAAVDSSAKLKQAEKLILKATRQKIQTIKSQMNDALSVLENGSKKKKSTAGSNEAAASASASMDSSECVDNEPTGKMPANGPKTKSRASRDRETNTKQSKAAATAAALPIQAARARNGGSTTSSTSLATTTHTNTSFSGNNKNRRPHASGGDKNLKTDPAYRNKKQKKATPQKLPPVSMPPRDLTQKTTMSNPLPTATPAASNKVSHTAAPPPVAAAGSTHGESRRSRRRPKSTQRGA